MSDPSNRFQNIGKHYEEIRATLDPSQQKNIEMVSQLMQLDSTETLTMVMALCGQSADLLGVNSLESLEILTGVYLIGLVAGMATERVDP